MHGENRVRFAFPISVFLVLLANILLARLAGPLSYALTNAIVLFLLLGFVFALPSRVFRKLSKAKIFVAISSLIVGFCLIIFLPFEQIFLRSLVVVLICLGISTALEHDFKGLAAVCRILAWSIFLFALLYLFIFIEPNVWFGLQFFAMIFSHFGGDIINQPVMFNQFHEFADHTVAITKHSQVRQKIKIETEYC